MSWSCSRWRADTLRRGGGAARGARACQPFFLEGVRATPVARACPRNPPEQQLAQEVEALRAQVQPLFSAGNYAAALQALASLRPVVDAFFDKVMVMAEDTALRHNRLGPVANLSNLFLGAADISKLQGRQEKQ